MRGADRWRVRGTQTRRMSEPLGRLAVFQMPGRVRPALRLWLQRRCKTAGIYSRLRCCRHEGVRDVARPHRAGALTCRRYLVRSRLPKARSRSRLHHYGFALVQISPDFVNQIHGAEVWATCAGYGQAGTSEVLHLCRCASKSNRLRWGRSEVRCRGRWRCSHLKSPVDDS
jgi:hypothetical protein